MTRKDYAYEVRRMLDIGKRNEAIIKFVEAVDSLKINDVKAFAQECGYPIAASINPVEIMRYPKWTVFANITPIENHEHPENKYLGTVWFFFETEVAADKCMRRLNSQDGCCATKRPFYQITDKPHMCAADQWEAK